MFDGYFMDNALLILWYYRRLNPHQCSTLWLVHGPCSEATIPLVVIPRAPTNCCNHVRMHPNHGNIHTKLSLSDPKDRWMYPAVWWCWSQLIRWLDMFIKHVCRSSVSIVISVISVSQDCWFRWFQSRSNCSDSKWLHRTCCPTALRWGTLATPGIAWHR